MYLNTAAYYFKNAELNVRLVPCRCFYNVFQNCDVIFDFFSNYSVKIFGTLNKE